MRVQSLTLPQADRTGSAAQKTAEPVPRRAPHEHPGERTRTHPR
ncbi:hypothetical protein ACS15_5448 [Ralstonia insidiosa]|uniref:Uncharacterized protein n=1 Tax=Ralstonia insidiosa TaxID=190721 RepID=A0AAC9FUC4_9RALS|nr:hypothetical protein ACS15_5448 [Ralstonia insidiosa]